MSLSPKTLDSDQLNWVRSYAAEALRNRRWVPIDMLVIVTCGVLAALTVAIEYAVFYTIAERLFGFEDANVVAPMFAAAGLVVAVAWHIFAISHRDSRLVRAMPYFAAFATILFVFGCGALLSAIVLQNSSALDPEMDFASVALDQLTLESEPTLLATIDASWTPVARLAYSLGIGFMSVILLFTIRELIHRTVVRVRAMSDRLVRAKHARKNLDELNEASQSYATHAHELTRLNEETPDDLIGETIDKIQREADLGLADPRLKLEKLDEQGRIPDDVQPILPREIGQHDAEILRAKLDALDAALSREQLTEVLKGKAA